MGQPLLARGMGAMNVPLEGEIIRKLDVRLKGDKRMHQPQGGSGRAGQQPLSTESVIYQSLKTYFEYHYHALVQYVLILIPIFALA